MENSEGIKPIIENKLETGKKVYEFLDKTGILETRKSDEKFENWFQNLSYQDYCDHLTRLNGIIRETPIKNRSIDGKNVEIATLIGNKSITDYLPPDHNQKDDLMRKNFEALKKISNNQDRALLNYYAIQAIHPYADGNGRTGRLLYEIFSETGKEITPQKLSDLLDHNENNHYGINRGRYLFSQKILYPSNARYFINRELAKKTLGDDFTKENGAIFLSSIPGSIYFSENTEKELSKKEVLLAKKILEESDVENFPFSGITLTKLLMEKDNLKKYAYKIVRFLKKNDDVVPEDYDKKILGIKSEDATKNFTKDDIQRLIEIHKEIKTDFIEDMIDIFVNPQNHQIKTEEGNDIPLKNIFCYTSQIS